VRHSRYPENLERKVSERESRFDGKLQILLEARNRISCAKNYEYSSSFKLREFTIANIFSGTRPAYIMQLVAMQNLGVFSESTWSSCVIDCVMFLLTWEGSFPSPLIGGVMIINFIASSGRNLYTRPLWSAVTAAKYKRAINKIHWCAADAVLVHCGWYHSQGDRRGHVRRLRCERILRYVQRNHQTRWLNRVKGAFVVVWLWLWSFFCQRIKVSIYTGRLHFLAQPELAETKAQS